MGRGLLWRALSAGTVVATVFCGLTWPGPAIAAPAGDTSGLVPDQYRVIDLGNLGGTFFGEAFALNDRGDVVGVSTTASGNLHPFLWRNGVMIDLGVLDDSVQDSGTAYGINNRGDVVGTSSAAGWAEHAFLWRAGTMTDLGTLGGLYSTALAINDRGWVVGYSSTANEEFHGFLWVDGVMIDLGAHVPTARAINDRGQITGGMVLANEFHAFRWHGGTFTDLGTTSGNYSDGLAINEAGWVVGVSESLTLPGFSGAFLWRDGTMTALPDLGGGYSEAVAINDHGMVLGRSIPRSGTLNSVIWWNGAVIDLAERGISGDGMSDGSGSVSDINNRAQIAGGFIFPDRGPSPALFTR